MCGSQVSHEMEFVLRRSLAYFVISPHAEGAACGGVEMRSSEINMDKEAAVHNVCLCRLDKTQVRVSKGNDRTMCTYYQHSTLNSASHTRYKIGLLKCTLNIGYIEMRLSTYIQWRN